MRTFTNLSADRAALIGQANRQGWTDYVNARSCAYSEQDATTAEDPQLIRAYRAGWRSAARGRRPLLLALSP